MKLKNLLPGACAVLGGILFAQVAMLANREPQDRWFASWAHSPKSVNEAESLAKQIVKGRVIGVQRADDLVVKVAGEPNGEDRIPIEVVTFALEGAYKGGAPKTVEVFHTGLSPMEVGGRAVPKRPENVKPGKVARPTARQASTVSLEDSPPYAVGERYVLFLTDGPKATVAGSVVQTQSVIAPEGRYVITAKDTLAPVVDRHFTPQLRAQRVAVLEKQLPRFNALPPREWHPTLQQLRIKDLEQRGRIKELQDFRNQIR